MIPVPGFNFQEIFSERTHTNVFAGAHGKRRRFGGSLWKPEVGDGGFRAAPAGLLRQRRGDLAEAAAAQLEVGSVRNLRRGRRRRGGFVKGGGEGPGPCADAEVGGGVRGSLRDDGGLGFLHVLSHLVAVATTKLRVVFRWWWLMACVYVCTL